MGRQSRSVVLGIVAAALALVATGAPSARAGEACAAWRASRLLVDADLDRRRFVLEPKGPLEFMPPFGFGEGRPVYHQTHALTLDVTEEVSLFYGDAPPGCVLIARDPARPRALKIPVFFVGRPGETRDELKENALRLQFAPSASLAAGQDFADISFRLKHGGSRFGDIKPFFRCGLTGLLVCEESCPADALPLAASLVNWVVKGLPWRETPAASHGQPPVAPAAPHAQPKVAQGPPPPAETAKKPERPPPAAEERPSPVPTRHIVLSLKRRTGEFIDPALVLQAEPDLKLAGIRPAAAENGLAVDLSEDAARKLGTEGALQALFKHHRIIEPTLAAERIELTVEPLYIRAGDLAIRIVDADEVFVDRCSLALGILPERRLGTGWEEDEVRNHTRGLPFVLEGGAYRLGLRSIDEDELLIATDAAGPVGMLANLGKACDLDGTMSVGVEEVRALTVTRKLRRLGPILFALFSTDGAFAPALPSAYREFWSASLDLAGALSRENWERKVLARVQSPGVSVGTAILQNLEGAEVLGGPQVKQRDIMETLANGSQPKLSAPAQPDARPIERFDLKVALRALRAELGIVPSQSAGREAYLLIAGSVKKTGSDFCRRATRPNAARSHKPGWDEQAGKAFVLEVWSVEAADAMLREGRAEPVADAPAGLFRCRIEDADGDAILLYAVSAPALTAPASRDAAFAYLKAQAVQYLRPNPTD